MRRTRRTWRLLFAILVALAALARMHCVAETPPPATSPGSADVALGDLPPEAARTLELIRRGGPFPYKKDGTVFGNREGLLPPKARGYYREYTVPTPGSRDRGARRIVAGGEGEVYYYTGDHYRSFRRVRE